MAALFLTKWTIGEVTRAPTAQVDFHSLGALDRIYDAAMTVSQDAGWASAFRSRWASAKSDVQYKKLIGEFDLKYPQKSKSQVPQGRAAPCGAGQGAGGGPCSRPEVGMARGRAASVVRSRGPEYLTEFVRFGATGR